MGRLSKKRIEDFFFEQGDIVYTVSEQDAMTLKIKHSILFGIAACLLSGAALYSQTPGQDEAEITDLFNKMVEAHSNVSFWGKMNVERLVDETVRQFEKEVYVNVCCM